MAEKRGRAIHISDLQELLTGCSHLEVIHLNYKLNLINWICAFFVLQIYSNLGISICLHRIRGNAKPWAKLRYSFLDLVFTDLHSKLKFILVIRVTFFGAHFYCMDYQCETSILIGKRHK